MTVHVHCTILSFSLLFFLYQLLGVLKVQAESIDRHYIAQWADRLGVSEEWGLFPEQ